MWLINSSIGRKVVMSVTGMALILFLTFHASMNVVALISAEGYNWICEMLGANWYAVAATVGLAALVVLHFVFAAVLTLQNDRARGKDKYAVTDKPEKVEWASQNMFVLGVIVILGMCLHLYNFWWNMMAAELIQGEAAENAANGVYWIVQTFSCPIYTCIYLVWLCALWFHLTHGFWSAMQTMGWSGKLWFCRWRAIGIAYSTVIILMFAAVAVAFCCGYRPADMAEACPGKACPATECCFEIDVVECEEKAEECCCKCVDCKCDPCECAGKEQNCKCETCECEDCNC